MEPNEIVVLALRNSSGGNAAVVGQDSSATLTIRDNDVYTVVINEIHYNPNDDGNYPDADYEFIELYNSENSSVDISNSSKI